MTGESQLIPAEIPRSSPGVSAAIGEMLSGEILNFRCNNSTMIGARSVQFEGFQRGGAELFRR